MFFRVSMLVALVATSTMTASAQRPMDQGEARVTARSDVRMGVESGPGTSGNKLQDMIAVVTTTLGDIRQCYASVTEERPTVQGDMRIRVLLPRGRGNVELRFESNTAEDRLLTRCIQRHLSRANFRSVARPANVMVALTFTNTAARGIHETRARSEEEADVRIRTGSDGPLTATGGTGEVRYRIVGDSRERIAAVHRGLRTAIAGLLDCRRRAGRRDMDPAGALQVQLTVARRGSAQVRTTNTTVRDERAPDCVSRAIRAHQFAPAAAGRSNVTLTFAGREHIAEAREE
jgi:hypothetical protein